MRPTPATVFDRSPVFSRLGFEPDYRLLVQGNRYPLNEAGLQDLLLSQRPLIGMGKSPSVILGISPFLFDPIACVGTLGQLDSNLYLLRCRP